LKRKRPIRHLIYDSCSRLTCNEEGRGCYGFLSSFSVCPSQGRSQFLVEADDEEGSLEHGTWLQWTKCLL